MGNLIEQLGGYEKAKKWNGKRSARGLTLNISKELLHYRREHNIFEHGDYIVWLFGYEPSYLYKVEYITDRGYSYGNDWGWRGVLSNEGVGHDFRHATDEEVKAGRRL